MVLHQAEKLEDSNFFTKMAQQLSGVTVVIIVAGGVLTFLLLFIFAKRQIMRFAIRSHRGPHTPLGYEANKVLTLKLNILSSVQTHFETLQLVNPIFCIIATESSTRNSQTN